MRLTICFESPYWIALLEDEHDGLLYAARHIFGPEPNEPQIYEFVQNEALTLMKSMTVGIPLESTAKTRLNPKRMQREVRRELAQPNISTQAQEAMRLELEQKKRVREKESRAERDAMKEYKRARSLEKAREKRKGH